MLFSNFFFLFPYHLVESGDKEGHSRVSNAQQDPIELMNEANQDRDGNLFFHILGCNISFMQHNTSLTTTLFSPFFVITGKPDNEAPVAEQTSKGGEGNELLTPKTPVTPATNDTDDAERNLDSVTKSQNNSQASNTSVDEYKEHTQPTPANDNVMQACRCLSSWAHLKMKRQRGHQNQ
jgi:hypothetical protein